MRKYKLIRFFMRIFYIFPVNKKKVFFSSFEGKDMTCNPKYIYLELQKRYTNTLKYVWELNEPSRALEGYQGKMVRHNALRYMYHIMTARVIITNTGISAAFPLRKKQHCINTWHGGGAYKRVGKDIDPKINGGDPRLFVYSNSSTDHMISACGKFTEALSHAIGLEKEKFLPIGMPRNDCLISNDEGRAADIKRKLGMDSDVKMVLYAPTFRGATGHSEDEEIHFDIGEILETLHKRFGGEWVFAYRCHYHLKSCFSSYGGSALDLSSCPDMQELLCAADVLISDYSSSIWDYSFTKKPCFLYCYDLDAYEEERDFYVPIAQWGFPLATDMQELKDSIAAFQEEEYSAAMDKHHRELESYESGHATQEVCDLIAKWFPRVK